MKQHTRLQEAQIWETIGKKEAITKTMVFRKKESRNLQLPDPKIT